MPDLSLGGAMNIVAHADDDILFMNPDIAGTIAAGETSTTVYVTAGDAGYDETYWMGREEGIKAAYGFMAGSNDWIDETVTVEYDGKTFEVASSTLASAPHVRLYFLRIPDGAGAIADPDDYYSLARLEDGTRESVTTVDGEATYTRDDLVDVLAGLMELHEPDQFRLQVSEGEYVTGEHTDHIHATEFAEEALMQYSGTDYQVTHYVNYMSSDLPENLTEAEADLSLEVMEVYAQFDPGVTDEMGNLLPEYVDWTSRQYVAQTDQVAGDPTGEEEIPTTDGADPEVTLSVTYSLGDDPDSALFDVNPATGEITPKDWFTPSLDDAWDSDEDYVYEVTRIATPSDGSEPTSETVRFDTVSEGELALLDGEEATGDPVPEEPDTGTGDTTPSVDDTLTVSYSLGDDPDSALFDVNTATGEITQKDWFTPSLDDAWDSDEDYIYEVTRIATPSDGGEPTSDLIRFDTVAEGELALMNEEDTTEDMTVGGAGTTGTEEPDPVPPTIDETVDTPPVETTGLSYSLDGPDGFLFEIDTETGAIATKDWFLPSYDDAWDQDENHIYEVTRIGTDADGNVASREFLEYQTAADDSFTLVSTSEDLMLALAQEDDSTASLEDGSDIVVDVAEDNLVLV